MDGERTLGLNDVVRTLPDSEGELVRTLQRCGWTLRTARDRIVGNFQSLHWIDDDVGTFH